MSPVLRVLHLPGVPVVAVRAWMPGGVRVEEIPGQALITGRGLTEGTEARSWRQLAEDAENRGVVLHSGAGMEGHGVAVEALAQDVQRALDWVAEMVHTPAFPEERLDWLRRQAAAELESLLDEPDAVAGWAFARQLYHPHPACRPAQGDPVSLRGLQVEACRSFHRASLQRGLVVAVAGDLVAAGGEDGVFRQLEALFGAPGIERVVDSGSPAAAPEGLPEERQMVPLPSSSGSEQAHLLMGHLTVPLTHEDLPALELAGIVLGAGAGLTGRIPARVREREGLAYHAGAQTVAGAGRDAGRLTVYVATAPGQVAQAEAAVREELGRLLDDGLTDQEVNDARSYLVGREAFRRETARQRADLMVEAVAYGLPVDRDGWRAGRWAGLDRKAVEAAVGRHLRPQKLRLTVGLPAAESSAERGS